ncbi:distal membrane-arm assembly complex protein 2 [Leptopilina boulardi]|uniref:distal membrane-arm assembly complex protein 2 n=1 Tax=Leptopilina boulardi TaxID=63433 RepID=UPI0021F56A98|nr:distal membrane-arm assembly complex protein 2 [Leptopilina boulardi]
MLIRKLFRSIEKNDINHLKYNPVISRYFCIDLDQTPVKRQIRKLRKWQKEPEKEMKSFFGLFDRTQAPGVTKEHRKAFRDTSFWNPIRGEEIDTSIQAIKEDYYYTEKLVEKENQKYIPERLNILGSDLAVAHFLIHRGGKVKFRNNDNWFEMINNKPPNLPAKFDPKYIISAVDCSNMKLYYEGLLNFENLTRAKWASFRNNQVFDEWCLDRIVGQMPCLEYLDVSNCPNLNERGLEALYKLFYLKKLIVTNYDESVAFELTCLMLEDCNPNLNCIILKPGETYTEKVETNKIETENKT